MNDERTAGVGKDLLANSGTANGLEGLYGGNAAGVNSTLQPLLTSQAVAPTGESPNRYMRRGRLQQNKPQVARMPAQRAARCSGQRVLSILAQGRRAISQVGGNAGQGFQGTNAGIQAKNAGVQASSWQNAEKGETRSLRNKP